MVDKSQAFVLKALDYSKTNSEVAPKSINVTEWQKDFDAVEDLIPI